MTARFIFNKKLSYWQKGEAGDIDFRPKNDFSNVILLYIFSLGIVVSFIVIILRLFQLTIVKGDYYSRLADENRIKEIIIEQERGKIVDRKGLILVQNKQANVENKNERLISNRYYQMPEVFAHLVGYRQLADENDLKSDNCLNKLRLGDKVGKKGIEKLYECDLRGKPGKKLVETDARGKNLKTITIVPPVAGQTIQLAIDSELQKIAYEQIKGKRAVVIGLKPATGEILVFASSPSFNPQLFEDGDNVASYFKDKNKPLFDRITDGVYPAGSLFKLVLASGALEDKTIDEQTLLEDNGSIKAGSLTFGNWYFLQYGKTEGQINIIKALQRSNDIFFYKLGEKMGPEKIKSWAEKLGYGKKTGIGFDEQEGTIPSPFWKEVTLKEKWYLGDTYNFSIGQGYLLATPLQVAQASAVFGSGGYLCQPLLTKVGANLPAGEAGFNSPGQNASCQKLPISQKTLDLIREGMKEACSTGGTGWPFFDFKIGGKQIQTACKTGTAESHAKLDNPHAWFTVFAPFDKPEIALTVLIEEGGQGSDVAAPIAKEILKSYFERSQ
jgi:penicillin-binding protein 2